LDVSQAKGSPGSLADFEAELDVLFGIEPSGEDAALDVESFFF